MNKVFREITHDVDFCVVGGGLAGMFAAISAARHGAKVALMHDRPVLGGNSSSEIRMWVGGAGGANNRETGILEEISLENLYRNPYKVYSIWDSILYQKVRFEPNITLILNCSCNDATIEGDIIKSIKGWQLTTQTWHTVNAKMFADCSGDSILAPLSGALFRWGREAESEYNEDIAPNVADEKTMGLSCLIQARETDSKKDFIPPFWAEKITKNELPHRMPNMQSNNENYWYLELGGTKNTIHDAEELRDELVGLSFGLWDFIKNSGECNADNWQLDWAGFLPGKRESRRYIGDYVMTQNDVRAEGRFDDLVAYGGWSMDDHHPEGFRYPGKPTIFHPAPSPYGIAYRCLYSKNVSNLFFAGRNISVTHSAMSSARVMATCAVIGQAVGTAASIAVKYDTNPRGVYEKHIYELQKTLKDDDCYLPWQTREISELSKNVKLTATEGDVEALRNGIERPMGDKTNAWTAKLGATVEYSFDKAEQINELRFVFDSDLDRVTISDDPTDRRFAMGCNIRLNKTPVGVPKTLVKAFKVEAQDDNGSWETIAEVACNYQRLVKIPVDVKTKKVRFVAEETWGSENVTLFAWDVK